MSRTALMRAAVAVSSLAAAVFAAINGTRWP